MTWKIHRINNATHEVTLRHEDGRELETIIPSEYHSSDETKLSWLKTHAELHDVKIEPVLPVSPSKPSNLIKYLLITQALVIITLILTKLI